MPVRRAIASACSNNELLDVLPSARAGDGADGAGRWRPAGVPQVQAGHPPLVVWLKKGQLHSFACSRLERHSFALCRGPWNAFDFVMVLAGYTAFIPMGGSSSNTGAVRALRALRALRPLRTIARFESLRSIIVCFLEVRCGQSWPP